MGMYTEVLLKAEVKESATKVDLDVLDYMFGKRTEKPEQLPEHKFFSLPRWDCIGKISSFYHIPGVSNFVFKEKGYNSYYIFSRSDIKNYDGEVEAFFDWAKTVLTPATGKVLGWSWYEEDDQPTLILVD